MSRKKITDNQIMAAVQSVMDRRQAEWQMRWPPDHPPPPGVRREEINQEVARRFEITMSASGMRRRLSTLVSDSRLQKMRLMPRIVFYRPADYK